MKKLIRLTIPMLVLLAGLHPTAAQSTKFTYQGRFNDGGAPANGSYDLEFSLFKLDVGGSAVAGPVTNSPVAVSNGLFTTSIDFGAGVFNGTTYWVQIGARTNGGGAFTDLTPRQELTPTPYAIYAEGSAIADSSVTSAKILDGAVAAADLAANSVNSGHIIDGQVANADLGNDAVNSAKVADGSLLGADLANNTVTSFQLADSINLGDAAVGGVLNVYRTSAGGPAITLNGTGAGGLQYLYAADGSVGITLNGNSGGAGLIGIQNTNGSSRVLLDGAGSGSGGQISLYAQDGSSTVQLYGESTGAGLINVNNNLSQTRVAIDGEGNASGGQINLYAADGANGITLYGDSGGGGLQYLYAADGSIGIALDGESGGAGYLAVYNTNTATRVALDGFSSNGGGEISVYDASTTETIELLGAISSTLGGRISVKQGDGTVGVEIDSETYLGDGGLVSVKNATGAERMELDGDDGDGGAVIRLHNRTNLTTITLDADVNGDGRITTQELQITGGSDLSEQFDIKSIQATLRAGMIVSIDPQNPGQLMTSTKSYDRTVAGVISGAGGVKPGMLMGQKGTKADGQHPVALTGRVYCWVDATRHAIEPGDLITTSDTPGHGMKATDHAKAQGAIIGKAMTALPEGKGLVLILVSLQ